MYIYIKREGSVQGVCIYQGPLSQVGYNQNSDFKWRTAGLNSVFLLQDWLPNQG